MRSANGTRRPLVYCADFKVVEDAAAWGEDVRLSDLEPCSRARPVVDEAPFVWPLFEKSRVGTGGI